MPWRSAVSNARAEETGMRDFSEARAPPARYLRRANGKKCLQDDAYRAIGPGKSINFLRIFAPSTSLPLLLLLRPLSTLNEVE